MSTAADGHRSRVRCAVIIVTHNSVADIGRCIASLADAAGNLALRVVVVDNASSDGTIELARTIEGVDCIESGGNLGYAGAINIGRQHARPYDALVIANPDLWFDGGSISELVRVATLPGVGVAVPRLLDAQGRLTYSIRREPSIGRSLGDALCGQRFRRRPSWLAETVYEAAAYDAPCRVEWATGAALALSEACDSAVGPWDSNRFFLYSEETDFARRARRAGFAIAYTPEATVRHRGGGSSGSANLVSLMAVNRVRYFEKWHHRPASSLFRVLVALGEFLRGANAAHRMALGYLLRRSSWSALPGQEPAGAGSSETLPLRQVADRRRPWGDLSSANGP